MKIQFLGSGSAFVRASENYQSNMLINNEVLFDCGTTINESLNYNNIDVNDLKYIFTSHLHADHIGGLEYIGFSKYFSSFPLGQNKSKLLVPKALESDLKAYLDITMDNTPDTNIEALRGYFECLNIDEMAIEDTKYKIIETDHTNKKSYGLILNNSVLITGDTRSLLNDYYDDMEVIFHDCEFANYKNGVHTQFHELNELDINIKSKMYLYHYQLGDYTYSELEYLVLSQGFKGLVKRGQEFII